MRVEEFVVHLHDTVHTHDHVLRSGCLHDCRPLRAVYLLLLGHLLQAVGEYGLRLAEVLFLHERLLELGELLEAKARGRFLDEEVQAVPRHLLYLFGAVLVGGGDFLVGQPGEAEAAGADLPRNFTRAVDYTDHRQCRNDVFTLDQTRR